VLLAGDQDPELERELRNAKLTVRKVPFSTFDNAAATKIRHFETYNRTAAAQHVADIVTALRAEPGAAIVATGDAALTALLAAAVVAPRLAVLDVGDFDPADDDQFAQRFYVPGLRRAGDFATAAAIAGDAVVVHGAGEKFAAVTPGASRTRLSAREIVARLRR
jgi:hypothetical protein